MQIPTNVNHRPTAKLEHLVQPPRSLSLLVKSMHYIAENVLYKGALRVMNILTCATAHIVIIK